MTAVSDSAAVTSRSRDIFTLIYAVFIAGLCSIIYELLIATTVTYFEGDSVRYFSLTIGFYMASMGVGAYTSKFATGDLLRKLVYAETLLGVVGGFSIPLLYLAYAWTDQFLTIYVFFTLIIGFLIGLEVPFLTRLLEKYGSLRVNIAHVLTLDYFGALIATIAFPLVLLPFLGTFRTGLVFGLMNMSIGLLLLWHFPQRIGARTTFLFRFLTLLIGAGIIAALVLSQFLLKEWNNRMYDARVIHSEQTRYQQIVLTKSRSDLRLFLDGNLQFSSLDEYRYHEALVHPALAVLTEFGKPKIRALFLGGGDGLAVREILKHPKIEAVTLVDLDPAVTRIGMENPHVRSLNEDSLVRDRRVRIINADAFSFLKKSATLYDLVIADLPDPNNTDLARLYSTEFFQLARNALAPDGVFLTQATSPFFAKKAFWTIHESVRTRFPHVMPFHVSVPSFGDWGFVLASGRKLDWTQASKQLPANLRFMDKDIMVKMIHFAKDLRVKEAEPSTLDHPIILRLYLDGWRKWAG
jgi:spermidine synthase